VISPVASPEVFVKRPRGRAAQASARPKQRPAIAIAPAPEELARRAQAGSVEAFSELVGLFQERLFNFLLRRASVQDAEDLTQETFIRAWQRIGLYRSKWRFSTWLFTIATRLAAGRARRIGSVPALTLTDDPRAAGLPHAGLEHAEESSRIWALVDEVLSPEQRAAVWLRYAEDLSMQEIAVVMGKSEVGVRVMLHRARGLLAERLRDADADIQPQVHTRGRAIGAGT
jgi:RNA polymerase sigma-70 factor, ECF subfamily